MRGERRSICLDGNDARQRSADEAGRSLPCVCALALPHRNAAAGNGRFLNRVREGIEPEYRIKYCVCKTSDETDTIECSSVSCAVGWWHVACVRQRGGRPDSSPDSIWLCPDCDPTSLRPAPRSRSESSALSQRSLSTRKKSKTRRYDDDNDCGDEDDESEY